MDEIGVSGNIDEAQRDWRSGRLALSPEVIIGVAEIDGQPPLFFCLQRVCLYPGELPDQRGLAVVDMTGGSNDQLSGITGISLRRRVAHALDFDCGSADLI